MSRKKDIWLILAVLAAALVLLLASRLIPKKTIDGRTAEATLAPDAIEYVDATAVPAPEATEKPSATEVPEKQKESVEPEGTGEVSDSKKPGKQEVSVEPEITAEPSNDLDKSVQSETEPEPTTKPLPEKENKSSEPELVEKGAEEPSPVPENGTLVETASSVTSEAAGAATVPQNLEEEKQQKSSQEIEKTAKAAGPVFGPTLEMPDEPVKGHVVIMVGGRQYGDPIPMDRDKIITIRQDAEKINRIHITRDSVYMESSTCENQDCVGEGEITPDNYKTRILGTYIVCLPNAVTVEMIPAETTEAGQ